MMRMHQKMSQLLIVDIQDKVFAPIPNKQDIVKRTVWLIEAAKTLDIPITVSEEYPKGLGRTVKPLQEAAGASASYFEKLEFSGVRNDALRHHLEEHRDHARGQIIIAGIEAHVCVTQTALDLVAEGYEVFVVADAIGSREEISREISLRRLERCGAIIVNSEMVIFEWLEKAGTPEFKTLLPLIK